MKLYNQIAKFGRGIKSTVSRTKHFVIGGAATLVGTVASATPTPPTIPTEMAPNTLVEQGLAALSDIFLPALTLVAVVGLALGVVRFVWGAARRGGKGG